jgi:F0F1-type ATP synthase membrane subunit b/b'
MLVAFITNLHGLALAGGGGVWKYLNYPGFEAWRFINLLVFAGILYYILRPPLKKAFQEKRADIKAQLHKAQAERDAAMAKLQEVEQRLTKMNDEMAAIRDKSESEATAEAARLKQATEEEVAKLRAQAQREIEGAAKLARQELKQFTAEQSVKMAEEILRRDMSAADDARLMKAQVAQIGGGK